MCSTQPKTAICWVTTQIQYFVKTILFRASNPTYLLPATNGFAQKNMLGYDANFNFLSKPYFFVRLTQPTNYELCPMPHAQFPLTLPTTN